MVIIDYLLGCRNCLKGDPSRHSYTIYDINNEEEYLDKTEFELVEIVEDFRISKDLHCPFCGSQNVEVSEIRVDGNNIYDYELIVERNDFDNEFMLQFNLDKYNGIIKRQIGGSNKAPRSFWKNSSLEILNYLEYRDYETFKQHDKGSFFACITGKKDEITNIYSFKLERMRYAGFSIQELINELRAFSSKFD